MEKIIKVKKENFEKVKKALLENEETSKLSITFREGTIIGNEDVYYILLQGPDEIVNEAIEMIKEKEETSEEEEKKVKEKMREEEKKAIEGFGNLF